MKTRFIEATNRGHGGINWGKFMLARFDAEEWARRSEVDGGGLVAGRGWDADHLLVLDLQTGEGAIFRPGGLATCDLNEKHRIWVCPMFEPFLGWLYTQDTRDLEALPGAVELDAESAMYGYRREGPK